MSTNRHEAERLLNTIVSSRVRLNALKVDPQPTPEESSVANLFAVLPPEDEHTDIGPPTAVLGIQPDDEQTGEAQITLPPPATMAPEPEPELDPFSFLDLIPPDISAKVPTPTPTPVHQPPPTTPVPPVRSKPLMPLPSGHAAGAPALPPNPTVGLAQPRAVAPRIIDPDAERLEVEVYEAHATYEDDTHTEWDTTRIAPTLTDTTDIPALPRPTPPEPTLPEEAIFDLVGDALAARDRGDIHAAERQLTAALDWQPNHIEARIARGQCLRDMGDIPAAMSDFIKCQRQAPHSPSPHIEIGNLFFAKKDYVRAISHYSDALSIQPEHTLALCRRGISHHYRRQPARAIDDLTVARRIDGNIPNIDRYIKMVSITEKPRS